MDNQYMEFPVVVYENLNQLSPVLSKSRCRIFYKGQNRNATFITDEFAEKLISTLPYTPVKGIYDNFEEDYTDHGAKRNLGRIYGIVPENPNFAWESHLDEDGIERVYACCDVLIFTALYEEASQIVGKAQSMELYQPSIKGNWVIIEGKRLYKFEDACFLGLQVLGEDIEPCFEGASFFSLYSELKQLVNKIEEYGINFQLKKEDKSEMARLNFKLSDSQKHDALWSLLNTNYNEEGGWIINYAICDIYDEYAIVRNYETGSFERAYYTKNDEADSVEITKMEKVYVLDLTEYEKNALEALRAANNGTYEKIDEVFAETKANLETANNSLNNANETISAHEQKIEELNISVSTLTTERDEAAENYSAAQDTISTLTEELEGLKQYKLDKENAEKKAVIDSYAELLTEEVLATYTQEKVASFTAAELDKELAYEVKKSNPSVFSKNPQTLIPKDEQLTGVEALLAKYKTND